MCSDELGIQLLFIPEEYGGMGGDTIDVYRVCEQMARSDVGVATSVLATFLGSDPIFFGATPDQKNLWLTEIAESGILYAYGATEPEAGSDLAALKTTATPVLTGDAVTGYRLNGRKQWISNGGIADKYTILASAPGGPSWFVLERGTEGFTQNKPEDKHGIRLSNTAALFLDGALVPADNLVGGVEGQGLIQAQKVFGYTRAHGRGLRPRRRLVRARPRDPVLHDPHPGRRAAVAEAGLHAQADRPARGQAGGRPRLHRVRRRADRRGRGRRRRAQHRGRDRASTWRPRPGTWPPTPPSRRMAATGTRAITWSRRSSAMSASPRSTKARPRSWR